MSATPRASAVMTRGRFGGRRALKRRRKRETSDSEFVVSELTGVRREASSRSFVNVRIPERFRAFRCRNPGELALDSGGEGVETVCGRLTSSRRGGGGRAGRGGRGRPRGGGGARDGR